MGNSTLSSTKGARFDWYAATVYQDEADVVDSVASALRCDVKPGRPLHGYERGLDLVDLDDERHVKARVLAGGRNGNPHVFASGEDAQPVADLLRAGWPDRHHVTRVDSALDYDEPAAFDKLSALCLAVADKRRLSLDQKGDWQRENSPAGRTLYVGSFKSPSLVRCYEKGKQMKGLAPSQAASDAISGDWVRLELQLRPQRAAKLTAAGASPLDVWGYGRWTRELLAEVDGYLADRVDMTPARESDDARAFRFMVKQYGAVLDRIRGERQWSEVGEWIGAALMLQRSDNDHSSTV